MTRGLALADAEDLLQDQFFKLAHLSGPIADPRAYLYRMTHNLLLDRRRSGARRLRRDSDWLESSGRAPDVDQRPSVEASLIAGEQLASMLAAITALPQRTGDIFRRHRIDGQTQKAIAAEIGISKSAVEKHLYRAFEAMAAARTAFEHVADATSPTTERLTVMGTRHDG